MQTPTITDVLSTRLGVDWIEEPFQFYVGAGGTVDNFAGCSITGGVYLGGVLRLDLSTSTGRTAIAQPSTVNITVSAADVATIGAGMFKVSLGLVTASNGTQDLLNFALEVKAP